MTGRAAERAQRLLDEAMAIFRGAKSECRSGLPLDACCEDCRTDLRRMTRRVEKAAKILLGPDATIQDAAALELPEHE